MPEAEPTAAIPSTEPTMAIPSAEPTAAIPTVEPTAAIPPVEPTAAIPAVDPAQAFPPASYYWASGPGLGATPTGAQGRPFGAESASAGGPTQPSGQGLPYSSFQGRTAEPGISDPAQQPAGFAPQPTPPAQPSNLAAYMAQPTAGQYQFTTQPGPYQDPNAGAYGSYLRWPPPTDQSYQAYQQAPAKRRTGRTALALMMAFLLGVGSFAVGGRVISSFTDQQTATPSVTAPQSEDQQGTWPQDEQTNPYYPQDEQSGEYPWGQDEQQSQQTQPTYPSSADASVTADQSKGIVLINGISGSSQSAGTGMILSADGKVLTNYHVVAGTEQLTVVVVDSNANYEAKLVGFDATHDVALLQLQNASGLQTITVDNDPVSTGSSVSVVGNAEGGGVLIRADGQVTGTEKSLTVSSDSPWGAEENLEGLIEANANAVPGDSGGPMFDDEAEVTGMTTAGSERESLTYAIPIADALSIVQVIEAGQDSGTVRVGPAGYLGISVEPARGHRQGRQIQTVSEGGPADQAGITAGSTLISVGDEEIRGDTNVANVVRALEPGSQVVVTWYDPYGEQKSATVTLGESPVN
jgi:S1-C subfamily serine protease